MRRRPPWWPEGEEWPPRHGAPAAIRRRFLLVVAVASVWLFVLILLAGWVASSLFDVGWKSDAGEWNGPPIGGLIVLGVIIVLIVRFVRRAAAPIADVMEAAERVAGGDYSARVSPRGPRDVRRLAVSFNQMTERLAASDQQRRRLLADVTHELRTPLSIIRGTIEGMLDGVYPRDEQHLAPLVDETKQMARLLDDLHTLATAEAGALRLHREAVDVAELVGDVATAFRPRAAEHGITLVVSAAAMPDVEIDPVRIRQVLENVLANALRYTPEGGEIRVEVAPAGAGVRCTVADTGPGVAPEQLPLLFDRFAKAVDSGGTGLGLAIARSLVEAHGGSISAESAPGEGLAIRFEIPAAGA